MDPLELLSVDPAVCHGQACVRRTRVPVSVVLDALAEGRTEADILAGYPSFCASGEVQARRERRRPRRGGAGGRRPRRGHRGGPGASAAQSTPWWRRWSEPKGGSSAPSTGASPTCGPTRPAPTPASWCCGQRQGLTSVTATVELLAGYEGLAEIGG